MATEIWFHSTLLIVAVSRNLTIQIKQTETCMCYCFLKPHKMSFPGTTFLYVPFKVWVQNLSGTIWYLIWYSRTHREDHFMSIKSHRVDQEDGALCGVWLKEPRRGFWASGWDIALHRSSAGVPWIWHAVLAWSHWAAAEMSWLDSLWLIGTCPSAPGDSEAIME